MIGVQAVFHNNTYDQPCFNITGQVKDNLTVANTMPASMATRKTMTSPHLRHTSLKSLKSVGPAPPPPSGPTEKGCTGSWGYQWCTEMVQPFTEGTPDDFYFCPNGTFYAAQNCSAWDIAGASQGKQRTGFRFILA